MWVTVWVTVSLVYMMFTAISMQWEAAKGWLTVFTHIQEVARPEIRTSKKSRIQEVAHPRNRVSRKPRSCVLNWLSVGMSVASYEASGRSDQTWGGYKLGSSTTKEFLQSTISQLQSSSTTQLTSQLFIMYSVRAHVSPLPRIACADHRCAPM